MMQAGLAFALFAAPLVRGHIAPFADFTFGANTGGDANLAEPLTFGSGGVDQWFFRGLTPDSANGVATLNPGGSLDLTLGCSKHNAEDGSDNPCNSPNDGALHRKSDGSGSGCALAISYKNFDDIQPTDLQVFSVNHDCVKTSKGHSFAIPDNLPAGDATCSFHWVPPAESSADEQYMTGFKCKVSGNNGGSISNAKSPLYWAANGVELPSSRPSYDSLPDGAQQLDVSGGAVQGNAGARANVNTGASESSNDGQQADSPSPAPAPSANANSGSPKKSGGRCKSGRRKRSVHRRHHSHDAGLVDVLSS